MGSCIILVMMFPVMKLLENYLIKDAHKNILKGVSIVHGLIWERECVKPPINSIFLGQYIISFIKKWKTYFEPISHPYWPLTYLISFLQNLLRVFTVFMTGCIVLVIPNFANLMALVGATCCTMLAFTLPGLFHMCIFKG